MYTLLQKIRRTVTYSMWHRLASNMYRFGKLHKSLYYHYNTTHKTNFHVAILFVESVPDKRAQPNTKNG